MRIVGNREVVNVFEVYAGKSIVQEVFDFIKEELARSEAKEECR